jgi:hypothetical protein
VIFSRLRHKDSKSKVIINLDCNSLVEFIEFGNMKDMIVGGVRPRHCEDPFKCECEDKSGQPCCI